MAAGCGRRDTLSMRGSPRSRFPSKQSGGHGCGSFFSRNLGWPHVQIRPARTIWRPQYTVSAPVFPNHKVGNPTHALCIGKAARNGGGDVARPCRHMLVEAKGFSSRWKWNFRKQASGSVPTANGGGERMFLYEMLIAIGIALVLVVA